MMGSGVASGEDRAEEAAEMAISPPLEDIDLSGARGVLVNITAGFDLRLDEFETVGKSIRAFASRQRDRGYRYFFDPDMNDELRNCCCGQVSAWTNVRKSLWRPISRFSSQ